MAAFIDEIKRFVNDCLNQFTYHIYFVLDRDFDCVDCICNACHCNIFLGVTSKVKTIPFKNNLVPHLLDKNHSKLVKSKQVSIASGISSYKPRNVKKFLLKLSYYFTSKRFEIIKKYLSVTFEERVVCLTCKFCCKEFITHFNCDLLAIFIDHFTTHHEQSQKLLKSQSNDVKLNFSCKAQDRRDPSLQLFKKLLVAQQKGILKPFLSYFKTNGKLKSNKRLFVKKSSSYGLDKSLIEEILNILSSRYLTDQVYFIVNKRQSIDCVCNICFSHLFKSITRQNFHLFRKTLIIHLSDAKHFNKLKVSMAYKSTNSTSDPISTINVDFRRKFIDKISKYFTKNNYLITSKLSVSLLRNDIVLVSCDFCNKKFIMHVNCGLKTSFVAHLKNPVHKKEIKKICDAVGKPKQSHLYRHQFDKKKFIEILTEIKEKTKKPVNYLFVELNEAGNAKLFCSLCRRKLPFDCEQPIRRITKALENHIKNSVNHLVKNGFKEGIKSSCAKQGFQYPPDFFLKKTNNKIKKCNSNHSTSIKESSNNSNHLEEDHAKEEKNFLFLKYFSHSQLLSGLLYVKEVLNGNSKRKKLVIERKIIADEGKECHSNKLDVIVNRCYLGNVHTILFQEDFSNSQFAYSFMWSTPKSKKLNEKKAHSYKIEFERYYLKNSEGKQNGSCPNLENENSQSTGEENLSKRQFINSFSSSRGNFSKRQLEKCYFPVKSVLKLKNKKLLLRKKAKVEKSKKFLQFRRDGNHRGRLENQDFLIFQSEKDRINHQLTRSLLSAVSFSKVNEFETEKTVGNVEMKNSISHMYKNHFSYMENFPTIRSSDEYEVLKVKKKKKLPSFGSILKRNSFRTNQISVENGSNNYIRKSVYNRNILFFELDYKTGCRSSILKSKKLQLKLRHETSSAKYSQPSLDYKKQRAYDFVTAKNLEVKHLKKCQISENFKRRKVDSIAPKKSKDIRQQRKKSLQLDMKEMQKYHYSEIVNSEVSSTRNENVDDDFQVKKISKKTRRKQKCVQFKELEEYINCYLSGCFQNFIGNCELFTENLFFSIINKYGERCLLCMFCRCELPYNCNLRKEYLCYLSILHLENCFNHLNETCY